MRGARAHRRQAPLVLCYHAVSDTWPDPLAIGAASIERQVESLLRRGFRPVTAQEALAGRGRMFHVTFDDAFENITRVLPALDRLGVHSTVFACSDLATSGDALLVPELEARAAGFHAELVTMTWDTLRALADDGVEIGSHTASHAHLTRLSDRELDAELRESRERVEAELSRPCRFIAYPYGESDERVRAATLAAGYAAGFALRPSGNGSYDPFCIPRVDVYRRDTVVRFRLKTSRVRPAGRFLSDLAARSR